MLRQIFLVVLPRLLLWRLPVPLLLQCLLLL